MPRRGSRRKTDAKRNVSFWNLLFRHLTAQFSYAVSIFSIYYYGIGPNSLLMNLDLFYIYSQYWSFYSIPRVDMEDLWQMHIFGWWVHDFQISSIVTSFKFLEYSMSLNNVTVLKPKIFFSCEFEFVVATGVSFTFHSSSVANNSQWLYIFSLVT